ncbi:hydroxymethylglutaryl-CoA lyase (plasmid) [Paroceanicella profunda]|uniref:Hydroxymethylglutaryl-CoA lyase n=1 Tax=Paroceanicella profunda TaxID=2579971 RepID=A0A5B8G1A8_9RHOB|nr:hydroxymethylglutaryl-CoA lyase [Paroceanicella profunda]QDL94505.1 hydroxymethylglutaryl-CoA lyase [Paroceanicella profunda]
MSRLADIYPADRVTLREVGLRDGLQLAQALPSTEAKRAWLAAEAAAGVRHFEVGSFLPAARFPQFADIDAMIAACDAAGAHSAALTLNERGIEAALASPVDELVCVVSATEAHSQANMRRSRAAAVALVARAVAERDARAPGKLVNAGIAMALGCSLSGDVAQDEVLALAEACLAAGADIVGLADTVGYAGPAAVGALCARMTALCGPRPYIIHLHDTRGMGVANAAAALDNGARVVDASLGGLGGCPFAPGATGNVVFEDIVFLAESLGHPTGIDLGGLRAARAIAEAAMPGEAFHGALHRAGPPANAHWRA